MPFILIAGLNSITDIPDLEMRKRRPRGTRCFSHNWQLVTIRGMADFH